MFFTAPGDENGVRECLAESDVTAVTHAFLTACGFLHKPVAALLLDRLIEFDPALGEREMARTKRVHRLPG
jgi:hypothetical protein